MAAVSTAMESLCRGPHVRSLLLKEMKLGSHNVRFTGYEPPCDRVKLR